MEPKEVFMQFVRLCDQRYGFLQHHLASNAILDWYGKTIRGKHRISSFVRYDIYRRYEHHFENVKSCKPFEVKPSHFKTREILPVDMKSSTNPINEAKPVTSLESRTPEHEYKSPELPPLTQGRIFRQFSDSDDSNEEDLSDLGVCDLERAITPPRTADPVEKKLKMNEEIDANIQDVKGDTSNSGNDVISKGNNSQKSKKDDNDDDDDDVSPDKCSIEDRIVANDDSDESSSSHSNQELDSNNNYTELMYIETVGILRILNKSKNRHSSCGGIIPETPSSLNSSSPWNRKTHLKISYRINKTDNQIQFALIIYEHITDNPTVRRNLFADFERVEGMEEYESESSKDLKRKTPTKRALRL